MALSPAQQEIVKSGDPQALADELSRVQDVADGQMIVMGLNMVQQQAYHRLLGKVFVHHGDCGECRETMQDILTMIAHNIEQIDQMLPAEDRQGLDSAMDPEAS